MTLSQQAPKPINLFLIAINSHDASALLPTLSEDLHFVDESENTHVHGPSDFVKWFNKFIVERKASVSVVSLSSTEHTMSLELSISGDYKADYGITEPFNLWWHFKLAKDLIKELRITDRGPDEPTMRAVFAAKSSPKDPISVIRNDSRRLPDVPDGH